MKFLCCFIVILSLGVLSEQANAQKARCFKKMTQSSGTFSSPRYPSRYPHNVHCEYIIRAPPQYYIEITFTKFKLQFLQNGKLTDYIKILDGGTQNRRQEVTYGGYWKTPFTFRSEAKKVTIIFISDDFFEYTGFTATYKRMRKCEVFIVENGTADCDVNELDLASHCNVSCDENYKLEGEERVQCEDGKFEKPMCVVDPASKCSMENLQQYDTNNCVMDEVTGEFIKCNYTCQKNYLDIGSGIIECVDGMIGEKPQCIPDPDVMEQCLESPNDTCPFSIRQTLPAVLEDSRDLEELPQVGRSKQSNVKTYRCDRNVCLVSRRTRKYAWKCGPYAKACQLAYNEPNKKRKLRKRICKGCQERACSSYGFLHIFFKP